MILQGWQCVGNDFKNEEGCGTIRPWGIWGRIPPVNQTAMLNCAVCHKVTKHQYSPGHQMGTEWREFQPER